MVGGVILSGAIVVYLDEREDKRMARPVGGFGDFVDGFIFVRKSERVEIIFSSSDIITYTFGIGRMCMYKKTYWIT